MPRALHAAEAKQRILNEASSAVDLAEGMPEEQTAQVAAEVYFAVLQMLAIEYQLHQDYRREWWPEHGDFLVDHQPPLLVQPSFSDAVTLN